MGDPEPIGRALDRAGGIAGREGGLDAARTEPFDQLPCIRAEAVGEGEAREEVPLAGEKDRGAVFVLGGAARQCTVRQYAGAGDEIRAADGVADAVDLGSKARIGGDRALGFGVGAKPVPGVEGPAPAMASTAVRQASPQTRTSRPAAVTASGRRPRGAPQW